VPPVGLADLSREVRGALVGPGRKELRSDACQAVLQGRPTTRVRIPAKVLEMTVDGTVGSSASMAATASLGIEERWLRAALVLRWFRQLEQAADRVAAHLQPSGDRCLGQALAVKPVNVGPVVH